MASSPTPGTRSAFLNTATQCSGFKLFVQCVELSLLAKNPPANIFYDTIDRGKQRQLGLLRHESPRLMASSPTPGTRSAFPSTTPAYSVNTVLRL
ncbi:hypothetical protein CMV_023965 [Castanea mollissima]|uniref:Uncharacterized protein n=1 Tax=Castanea mollissima TaxID=60419 RepID=A0A8J4VIF3_9ROSI|nr:hypothetical protein CMV_023965 [Castanea mollissima]